MTNEDDDRPTVYGASTSRYWAKSFSEYGALAQLAKQHGFNPYASPGNEIEDLPDGGTVEVLIVEGRGNIWPIQSPYRVGFDGDEIVNSEKWEIPVEEFADLVEKMDGVEILAENCFVEGEQFEE